MQKVPQKFGKVGGVVYLSFINIINHLKLSIMITTLLTIAAALTLNAAEPVQSESFVEEPSTAEVTLASEDKCLGTVALCDPEGTTCMSGTAYEDSENGRIYVRFGSTAKYYAQKSNKPYWSHMIRYDNKWLYFSF